MAARVSSPGLMEERSGGGHEVLGSNPAWNTTNLEHLDSVCGVAVVVKLHLMVGLTPTDRDSLHTQIPGSSDSS
jgi:hypothetical protein